MKMNVFETIFKGKIEIKLTSQRINHEKFGPGLVPG